MSSHTPAVYLGVFARKECAGESAYPRFKVMPLIRCIVAGLERRAALRGGGGGPSGCPGSTYFIPVQVSAAENCSKKDGDQITGLHYHPHYKMTQV